MDGAVMGALGHIGPKNEVTIQCKTTWYLVFTFGKMWDQIKTTSKIAFSLNDKQGQLKSLCQVPHSY
jgi:hypothetical protein